MSHQLQRVDTNFLTEREYSRWDRIEKWLVRWFPEMASWIFCRWSEDLDGPVHAQTIAPRLPQRMSRPWGCSFSIQSDALRRSRTDLFRTIDLAQTRCHRLQYSPLLGVRRPNPIRVREKKGRGKKRNRLLSATASFRRFKDETSGRNRWHSLETTCDELRVKSSQLLVRCLEYPRRNDRAPRVPICMRHDRGS